MSEEVPKKEDRPKESKQENAALTTEPEKENRIVILRERDIPFEEERPPNFSPHFSIKVHRVRKSTEPEDKKE